MDFINLTFAPIDEAVDRILEGIKKMYNMDLIDPETEIRIQYLFDDLLDDLTVCIEYPYVDKVYRDSYYNYFASKHFGYNRDCLRVLFFNKTVEEKHFKGKSNKKYLQDSFCGYVVIRPTFPRIIGRTLVNKKALKSSDFVVCQSKGNILLNGVKLTVEGFPFSSQDKESITCAETSIWALMEYFGTRYPEYKPTLPSKIVNILNHYSNERMLPSAGLSIEQISFALKDFGFGTYIYSREQFKGDFENIIATYVESGIPVVATLYNDSVVHAALIIGHEIDKSTKVNQQRTLRIGRKSIKYNDYTDILRKYVIQDDNLTPYKLVQLGNPAEHYESDSEFQGCVIDSIVVPLYPKIYLEADQAKKLATKVLSDSEYGYPVKPDSMLRFYLTSSRSFKDHIGGLPSLDPALQNALLATKMPKFVWCAEIFTKQSYSRNQAVALLVLDATEASENMAQTLIFAGYPDRSIFNTGKKIATYNNKLNLYTKFKNNLV
jgi:hypothetical protein